MPVGALGTHRPAGGDAAANAVSTTAVTRGTARSASAPRPTWRALDASEWQGLVALMAELSLRVVRGSEGPRREER